MQSFTRQSVLGSILPQFLATGSPDSLPQTTFDGLLSMFPGEMEGKEHALHESLKIMTTLSLICDEGGQIKPTSRKAYFTLASLAKYLEFGVSILPQPIRDHEQAEYFAGLTKILERMREIRPDMNKEPIHKRRIINILIKSRQNRAGRKQDVFLHTYHSQWGAYHLIGLSKKRDDETDETIVEEAMRKQLGQTKNQYEIDRNFKPDDKTYSHISETSGALTEYTYRLFRVEKFYSRLELKALVEAEQIEAKTHKRRARFDLNTFRWFTASEIEKEQSIYGEKIMFSSKLLFEAYDLAKMPVNAPEADDVRYKISLRTELGNRISLTHFIFSVIAFLLLAVLFVFARPILSFLGTPQTHLDNLGGVIQVISFLANCFNIYLGYRRSQR